MKTRFTVVVMLKEGLLDPQGKAIEDALPTMGWTNVSNIRVGKHIEFEVESEDQAAAREQAGEIARRLLSNPVIEDVRVSWRSDEAGTEPSGFFTAEVRHGT